MKHHARLVAALAAALLCGLTVAGTARSTNGVPNVVAFGRPPLGAAATGHELRRAQGPTGAVARRGARYRRRAGLMIASFEG